MTDTNKLLTIDELQEAQYFSDEQKEFLKDYQFSYILQGYWDESMQTDDDCGHSITKIAVVKNDGYGDINDIGTINIETTTFCCFDGLPTLFGRDDDVEHHISSDNISGFPSHCNKATTHRFKDNREEVFDKLGILNDAEKWFLENAFTEEGINHNNAAIKYIEDTFSEHIFCDKCHSIISSSHWKNYGLFRTYEMQGVGEDAIEVERAYFDVECPICKERKEVDEAKHLELCDYKVEDTVESKESQNPFENLFENNETKNFGPKSCPICGKMFCEHRYPF